MKSALLAAVLALWLLGLANCSKPDKEKPLTAAEKVQLGMGDSGGTDENVAIQALHTIAVAQNTYSASNPDKGYACSLDALGQANLIDPALASGAKSGYSFGLSCSGGAPAAGYRASAMADARGKRVFCTDESGAIKVAAGSADSCFSGSNLLP